MKRRKKLLWALAAAVVLLTLWLWAAHIPVSALCTPLEQPEEITRLTVQVDAGESFPLEYITLQDPEEFRPILEQLDGLRVSFLGFQGASDAGIPYDPRQGDYIAVVSVAHESLYLKGDGSLYTSGARFQDSSGRVAQLYRYLVEHYAPV